MPRGARNIYTGGTQTTIAPTANPRNNRGGRPGGSGGSGNSRVPKGGLYGGKSGEAVGNQAPDAFFLNALRQGGVINDSGTELDTFTRDQSVQNLMGQYNAAQALNQRLSASDFLKQQYGAGYGGRRGQNFQAGSLTGATGPIAGQFQTNFANQNPLTHMATQGAKQGFAASNGNDDFQNYFNTVYAPQQELQWRTAQRDNPQVNFDTFSAGLTPEMAQRAFAHRAPRYRTPSANAPTGGRWSWWS